MSEEPPTTAAEAQDAAPEPTRDVPTYAWKWGR